MTSLGETSTDLPRTTILAKEAAESGDCLLPTTVGDRNDDSGILPTAHWLRCWDIPLVIEKIKIGVYYTARCNNK